MSRSVTTFLGWPSHISQPRLEGQDAKDFEAHKRAGWVCFAWEGNDLRGLCLSMQIEEINEFTTRWLMNGEIVDTHTVKDT